MDITMHQLQEGNQRQLHEENLRQLRKENVKVVARLFGVLVPLVAKITKEDLSGEDSSQAVYPILVLTALLTVLLSQAIISFFPVPGQVVEAGLSWLIQRAILTSLLAVLLKGMVLCSFLSAAMPWAFVGGMAFLGWGQFVNWRQLMQTIRRFLGIAWRKIVGWFNSNGEQPPHRLPF